MRAGANMALTRGGGGEGDCAGVWNLWSAGEKFVADDGWAIASYIGLTLLTSLFPFLIFVAALAGFFGSGIWPRRRRKLVFAEWPEVVARPIAEEVSSGADRAAQGGLLTFGAVLSSYFASSAIEALRVGLNRAYGLVEPRPWWLLRLAVAGLVLVGSIALLALAFLVVLGPLILDTLGGLFARGGGGARSFDVRAHRRRGVDARDLARSCPSHPARAPGRVRGSSARRRVTFMASIAFGEVFGVYLSQFFATTFRCTPALRRS